jgi:hypothetical protein
MSLISIQMMDLCSKDLGYEVSFHFDNPSGLSIDIDDFTVAAYTMDWQLFGTTTIPGFTLNPDNTFLQWSSVFHASHDLSLRVCS